MTTDLQRDRRGLVQMGNGMFLAALLLALLAIVIGPLTRANAAGTNSGAATVVYPEGSQTPGQPLTSGGTGTEFTLALPQNAACTGDGVAGYRVQSFMVPASVDPGSLTYGSSGPTPAGTGASFRQPLWKTDDSRYVNDIPSPGDGKVINVPSLVFSTNVYSNGDIPPGDYNIGIACTNSSQGQALDRYWVGHMTFVASNSDPLGVTWTSQAATTTTTTGGSGSSTTSTTSSGAGTGSTTSTTAGGSSASSSTTSSSTTSTTRATTTTSTTTRVSAAASDPRAVARTGSNVTTLLFAAFVLAVLGRMAVLVGRPSTSKGSHLQ